MGRQCISIRPSTLLGTTLSLSKDRDWRLAIVDSTDSGVSDSGFATVGFKDSRISD